MFISSPSIVFFFKFHNSGRASTLALLCCLRCLSPGKYPVSGLSHSSWQLCELDQTPANISAEVNTETESEVQVQENFGLC